MNMKSNVPEFIVKIDWSLLRTQKGLLLETINNDSVDPEHKEALEGILSLIDAVQDYAVEALDLNANDVYDFEVEDNEGGDVSPTEKFTRRELAEAFANKAVNLIYEIRVERESTYTDDEMSHEFMQCIIDEPLHAEVIKSRMIELIMADIELNLVDFKHNDKGELMFDNDMIDDYGGAMETYCREIWKSKLTRIALVCPNCDSLNVEYKTWTNPNTKETTHDHPMEDGDCFCNDCGSHDKLIRKIVPLT